MRYKIWLVCFIVLLSAVVGNLYAQTNQSTPVAQLLLQWNADLAQSNKSLADPDLDDETLKHLREHLNELQSNAGSVRDQIVTEVTPLRNELTALGPPPARAGTTESEGVANKRKALNDQLAVIEGQAKELELVISSSDDALDKLSALRIQRFTQESFPRGLSPFPPDV